MAGDWHSTERLAVLSDIHGNIWALEAVLYQIDRMRITDIVNLGDSLYGPLDPAGTAQKLIERDIPSIPGNQDRLIIERVRGESHSPTLDRMLGCLAPSQVAWLQSLPFDITIDGVFYLCHGTPTDDSEYLLRKVDSAGVFMRKDEELSELLNGIDCDVVLCGHDHQQADRRLLGGKLIVDPGSVGLPAYTDDTPFPHAMEAGSPHARFSTVERLEAGWMVKHHRVRYDWGAAAERAERNDRPDWASWLGTGKSHV
jgi:predicted phosphodiesterase